MDDTGDTPSNVGVAGAPSCEVPVADAEAGTSLANIANTNENYQNSDKSLLIEVSVVSSSCDNVPLSEDQISDCAEPCDQPANFTDTDTANKTEVSDKNNASENMGDLPLITCRSDTSLLKKVLLKNTLIGPTTDSRETEKLEIFVPETGPKWYNVHGPIVTPRLVTKNLPEAFNYLPVHGRPDPNDSVEEFQDKKIREFIGCDLNDEEYKKLSEICSPDHLRTGKELAMTSSAPMLNYHSADLETQAAYSALHESSNLCVVKKHKLRMEKDETRNFTKKLKYRGLRLMPLSQQKLEAPVQASAAPSQELLEPGADLLFHIRIYRPFLYNMNQKILTGALAPCRHSVLSRDVLVSGRSRLRAVRERCVCANDGDSRHDVSARPLGAAAAATATAKELFPSGFLFINNVFYVDDRPGCKDLSVGVRQWAEKRRLGQFPCKTMDCRLQDIPLRLGHPEVYVHQGNCEHLFTISEVRLVNVSDPLNVSHYPCHTALSQNQSVYCTTCAEFCAKWIVVGSKRVPFDPAFFCDTCLKLYLYVGGKKIEDFKLYAYRGNEMNILKPQS